MNRIFKIAVFIFFCMMAIVSILAIAKGYYHHVFTLTIWAVGMALIYPTRNGERR